MPMQDNSARFTWSSSTFHVQRPRETVQLPAKTRISRIPVDTAYRQRHEIRSCIRCRIGPRIEPCSCHIEGTIDEVLRSVALDNEPSVPKDRYAAVTYRSRCFMDYCSGLAFILDCFGSGDLTKLGNL